MQKNTTCDHELDWKINERANRFFCFCFFLNLYVYSMCVSSICVPYDGSFTLTNPAYHWISRRLLIVAPIPNKIESLVLNVQSYKVTNIKVTKLHSYKVIKFKSYKDTKLPSHQDTMLPSYQVTK